MASLVPFSASTPALTQNAYPTASPAWSNSEKTGSKLTRTSSSTPQMPLAKCIDYVFSKDFKRLWDEDFENPCVTPVGQFFDKYFWGKHKVEEKKRMTDCTYRDNRQGFFFTNWPPFSFSEGEGWEPLEPCEQGIFDFPSTHRGVDDIFFMDLYIGSKSCCLYTEQEECIRKNLGEFFARNGKYDNATELFDANTTEVFSEYSMEIPSEILPLNWTIAYLATRKVSSEYLAKLKTGFQALPECEKKEYLKQTLGFSLPVGAAGFVFLVLSGCILHAYLVKKDPVDPIMEELTDVRVSDYGAITKT